MHLPHSPLPYFVAAVVIYAAIVAVVIFIRIWRRPRDLPQALIEPKLTSNFRDASDQMNAYALWTVGIKNTMEFTKAMNSLNRTAGMTAVQFRKLARKLNPPKPWLSSMCWNWPTWRVTARPFDWRND